MPKVVEREAWSFEAQDGTCPFQEWFDSLVDIRVEARVAARIRKMEEGTFGDTKSLGNKVYEARIHLGAGWRIYYGLEGQQIIILLVGGSKRTQKRDVKRAKEYWEEYEKTKTKRKR